MDHVQAPVSGSKKPAIDGTLIFLCGGNEAEFQEVHEALSIMGKASHLIGDVGAGARMKLVVNLIMGAQLCASFVCRALLHSSYSPTASPAL